MAFRFQRRIKVLPGITLNLSKGGVSTSVGVRGARVNFGRGKTRATIGVPGTGLSYSETENTGAGVVASALSWIIFIGAMIVIAFLSL